ncbi:unnamed protein product [Pleuronectes platessa]|uniref:Uncharacterized protein n=1 Tax=Pleuronectes platessa TaxID=8262 RepID=A0A9N7U263_PLEPL|nr:unnamed protein product [Pleuronectes platessa]
MCVTRVLLSTGRVLSLSDVSGRSVQTLDLQLLCSVHTLMKEEKAAMTRGRVTQEKLNHPQWESIDCWDYSDAQSEDEQCAGSHGKCLEGCPTHTFLQTDYSPHPRTWIDPHHILRTAPSSPVFKAQQADWRVKPMSSELITEPRPPRTDVRPLILLNSKRFPEVRTESDFLRRSCRGEQGAEEEEGKPSESDEKRQEEGNRRMRFIKEERSSERKPPGWIIYLGDMQYNMQSNMQYNMQYNMQSCTESCSLDRQRLLSGPPKLRRGKRRETGEGEEMSTGEMRKRREGEKVKNDRQRGRKRRRIKEKQMGSLSRRNEKKDLNKI